MRLIAVRTLSPIGVPPAAAAGFSPRLIHRLPAMASSLDKGAGGGIQTARSDEGAKPEAPKKAALPEPPEKPLPGDCCGSGCVRCVWDVYYEELEAYNKCLALLNSDDKSGSA